MSRNPLSLIDFRFIFTPFATVNRFISGIGRTDYYIFGIRVASVQKTKPWEN
jgi:hypothetical protein